MSAAKRSTLPPVRITDNTAGRPLVGVGTVIAQTFGPELLRRIAARRAEQAATKVPA